MTRDGRGEGVTASWVMGHTYIYNQGAHKFRHLRGKTLIERSRVNVSTANEQGGAPLPPQSLNGWNGERQSRSNKQGQR